jgi:hypothetical protein
MPGTDWKARAEREAAAILAENVSPIPYSYSEVIALVAIGWLQGVNYGEHETLSHVEDAFDELRAAL